MVCDALEGVNFEWSLKTSLNGFVHRFQAQKKREKSSNNSYACKPSRPKDAVLIFNVYFGQNALEFVDD